MHILYLPKCNVIRTKLREKNLQYWKSKEKQRENRNTNIKQMIITIYIERIKVDLAPEYEAKTAK